MIYFNQSVLNMVLNMHIIQSYKLYLLVLLSFNSKRVKRVHTIHSRRNGVARKLNVSHVTTCSPNPLVYGHWMYC